MSITIMSQVYATKLGNPTLKAVALKLADYADDDGTSIFPALDTIANHTEVSKSTVQRAVKGLLTSGVLEVVKQGGSGPRHTTEYRFNLEALALAPRVERKPKVVKVTTLAKVVTEPSKVVTVTTEDSQGDHQPIIETSRNTNPPKVPQGGHDGFDKFWEEYPKGKRSRQAKAKARDLYRKAIKSGEITEQGLLEAIRWYGLSKPDPDFIPMPKTWLNERRWEDDVAKPRGIAANSSKGEFTPEPAKVLPTDRQLKAPVWKETPVRRWFRADTPEFNHHVSELIKTGSHAEAKRVQQAGRVLAYPLTAAGDVVQRIVGKVAAKSDNRLAGVL